jgi:hypothetical protein
VAELLGIRIRHRTLRNCVVAVPLLFRPLKPAPWYGPKVAKGVGAGCPTCGIHHQHKTYHLNLEGDGGCVVSQVVFNNLCRAGAIDGTPAEALATLNGGPHPRLQRPFEYVDRVEPVPRTLGLGPGGGTLTDAEGRLIASPEVRPQVTTAVHLDPNEARVRLQRRRISNG